MSDICSECMADDGHDPLCPAYRRALFGMTRDLGTATVNQLTVAVPTLARGYLRVAGALLEDAWKHRSAKP